MPFKLKLKKTRQYNVASKNLFVISVELLDGGVADCTLSVDSTGQECLDNVCQRQAVNQPEFFGLRYINRSQQPRWVQLERPLKRQLDKYASSHQLYLRVMYYVISGTSLITDEVTRYHYFLQLKNDLVEGRIICDCQQAVVLASYSRQAEYGNHDRERHTIEYLKNLLTFPKQMIDGGQVIDGALLAETGRLEWMTSAVIQHHMTLHNMSQAQAEEGFIKACQQLRGYGQEMFLAHDQRTQAEVTIAISLTGIMLLSENSDTPHFYRWTDITNVINHKRSFSIECARSSDSAAFSLRTPEDGNYVWRCAVQQHTFYMRHRPPPALASALATPALATPVHTTHFQEHGLSESREELNSGPRESETVLQRAHSTSCLELERQQPRRSIKQLLPSYRPAPDYETAVQQKYQQRPNPSPAPLPLPRPSPLGSHPDLHRLHHPDLTLRFLPHNSYTPFAVNPNVQTELNPHPHYSLYKPPPPYPSGLASNSTPDLAVASQALYHRGYINSHVSGSSPDLVSNRTALSRQYLGYINTGNVIMNCSRPNLVPSTHGTYNNLASVLDTNPRIIIDPHHISDSIQKLYDERGNVMYSMPAPGAPYQRHVVLPQSQQILNRSDTEPIYENVPLPWQSEKATIRDRAQSLTTTDEISRLNERNSSHPSINNYGNVSKTTLNVPSYVVNKTDSPDSHYVNAQIIKDVRESSLPKDLSTSNRSINRDEFENVQLSIDRLSINDETPYQSLSTHKNNNIVYDKTDNITSISVPDVRNQTSISTDSALTSSIMNSTYSATDLETSGNTTKSTVSNISSKEKKRRRWGVFMGRGKGEVKSATLGRDKAKAPPPVNKHRWSTGLPKFQPLPPSITKETLCQILERKMTDSQLSFAFEQIPKGRETGGEMATALLPENSALNGHSVDSLPYEDNRVRLPPSPSNRRGYINASHITMTVGSKQRFYILCKLLDSACPAPAAAPPPDPVWQCWWGAGAAVMAVVGNEPQLPTSGKLTVRVIHHVAAPWGGSSRVQVTQSGRTRAGWLVHYAAWRAEQPAPPDPHHFLSFISEVNSLRLAVGGAAPGGDTAPAVCAAARGARAGLVIAADLLLQHLDNNQELDIPRTIGLLHQQRANIIENVHQYRFLHQLLLLYLRQSRLI